MCAYYCHIVPDRFDACVCVCVCFVFIWCCFKCHIVNFECGTCTQMWSAHSFPLLSTKYLYLIFCVCMWFFVLSVVGFCRKSLSIESLMHRIFSLFPGRKYSTTVATSTTSTHTHMHKQLTGTNFVHIYLPMSHMYVFVCVCPVPV